jgi:hypothetical protein
LVARHLAESWSSQGIPWSEFFPKIKNQALWQRSGGPGSGRRVVLAGADLGAQDLAGGTGIGCFHLGRQLQYSPLPAKGVLLADYANLGRSGLSVSRISFFPGYQTAPEHYAW